MYMRLLPFLAFFGAKGISQASRVFSKIILWPRATAETNGKLIALSSVIVSPFTPGSQLFNLLQPLLRRLTFFMIQVTRLRILSSLVTGQTKVFSFMAVPPATVRTERTP